MGWVSRLGAVIRPIDLLLDFLNAEVARGETHCHLDEGAREALRDLHEVSRGGGRKAVAGVEAAKEKVVVSVRESVEEVAVAKPAAVTELRVEGVSREERLESLRKQAEVWEPARGLGTLREMMVFATGNPEARVMLVGEAPGYEEERQGIPFVGPAGQKLTDILKAMGIKREDVYISNIVKFRPATAKQATNNRKPTAEEMAACLPFVRAEIEIIRPECIIALGGTAGEGLLGLTGTVTSMRGKWHDCNGIPARVTFHPSYLLQSGDALHIKRQVWEDMLEVMEQLGMPISEKQRGFFLPKA